MPAQSALKCSCRRRHEPLFRGGRPEWKPGIVASDRRRPAASNNTDSITPSSTRTTTRASSSPAGATTDARRQTPEAGHRQACQSVRCTNNHRSRLRPVRRAARLVRASRATRSWLTARRPSCSAQMCSYSTEGAARSRSGWSSASTRLLAWSRKRGLGRAGCFRRRC